MEKLVRLWWRRADSNCAPRRGEASHPCPKDHQTDPKDAKAWSGKMVYAYGVFKPWGLEISMLSKLNSGLVGADGHRVFSIGRMTEKNPRLLLLFYLPNERSQLSLMQWANLSRQDIRKNDAHMQCIRQDTACVPWSNSTWRLTQK